MKTLPKAARGGVAPWIMAMQWQDLLFAHWPLPPDRLRHVVPDPLELDTFDGQAWLGVVPFRMSAIRPRMLPPLPHLSRFPEINLRTYVRYGDRRGVYLFSLDATQWLAVRVARRFFNLPYFDARIQCDLRENGWVDYRSTRTHRDAPPAEFVGRYRPIGPPSLAAAGSLEHFLTERYCFLTVDPGGSVWCSDIEHAPWPLQPARCEIERCDMTAIIGRSLPACPPILHFASDLAVRARMPHRCKQ